MCEARVYLHDQQDEHLIMRDVVRIEHEGENGRTIVLGTLFGEQKLVEGHIVSIDFLRHSVVIQPEPKAGVAG